MLSSLLILLRPKSRRMKLFGNLSIGNEPQIGHCSASLEPSERVESLQGLGLSKNQTEAATTDSRQRQEAA